MQKQIFRVLSQLMFATGLAVTKRYLLNYSWRKLLIWTGLFICIFDSIFSSLAIFAIVRNQYAYLRGGESLLPSYPPSYLHTT